MAQSARPEISSRATVSCPQSTKGIFLAILDAGAYGMVLASNYNTRPRPAEVLVTGKSAKVIRRREKLSRPSASGTLESRLYLSPHFNLLRST